ncbi:MAG: tetratricopeptide repeat protein, partial [Chloroflexota bacterium]
DISFAEAYHNRGGAYYYLGDFEKSIPDFTQAIEFGVRRAYLSRGLTYIELRDFEAALADFEMYEELLGPLPDWAQDDADEVRAYLAEQDE